MDQNQPETGKPTEEAASLKIPEEKGEATKKDLQLFMGLACMVASRSKDDVTKVGAVIVRDNRQIVATGYNGHIQHRGFDNDAKLPWDKKEKQHYVCHAEFNAILNKNEVDVKDCTIYVTLFPCNECTKLIIEAGITEVIYYEGPRTGTDGAMKSSYSASIKMMNSARKGFKYRSYTEALTGASEEPQRKKFEFDDLSRPNWDQYFMSLAYVASLRSDDPKTKVGACLVNEKQRVVGIGYNAMPHDCDPNDFSWDGNGEDESKPNWIKTKYPYVIHAVQMAVLNKNTADVEGCTLYTTLFPDSDCARIIIQSGITRVVYWSEYSRPDTARFEAARMMFRKILDSDAEEAGQGQSRTINNRKFELTAYTRAFDHVKIKFTVIDNVIEVFPDK